MFPARTILLALFAEFAFGAPDNSTTPWQNLTVSCEEPGLDYATALTLMVELFALPDLEICLPDGPLPINCISVDIPRVQNYTYGICGPQNWCAPAATVRDGAMALQFHKCPGGTIGGGVELAPNKTLLL